MPGGTKYIECPPLKRPISRTSSQPEVVLSRSGQVATQRSLQRASAATRPAISPGLASMRRNSLVTDKREKRSLKRFDASALSRRACSSTYIMAAHHLTMSGRAASVLTYLKHQQCPTALARLELSAMLVQHGIRRNSALGSVASTVWLTRNRDQVRDRCESSRSSCAAARYFVPSPRAPRETNGDVNDRLDRRAISGSEVRILVRTVRSLDSGVGV